MLKAKRGPALFEVLMRGGKDRSEAVKVPAWWNRGRQPKSDAVAEPVKPEWVFKPAPPEDVATGVDPAAVPLVELDGARIRVALSSRGAAVAIFVALIALVLAYESGRKIAGSREFRRGFETGRASLTADAANEIEAVRNQPPATQLVSGLLVEPPAKPAPSESVRAPAASALEPREPKVGWVKGNTYIVVQEFGPTKAGDAKQVQDFLADFGVATTAIRLAGGAVQLITTDGYNAKDPAQKRMAEQRRDAIHAIGEKYVAAGGQYRLKGYLRTLTGDNW